MDGTGLTVCNKSWKTRFPGGSEEVREPGNSLSDWSREVLFWDETCRELFFSISDGVIDFTITYRIARERSQYPHQRPSSPAQ